MKLKIENLKKEPFKSKAGADFVRVSVLSGGQTYTCLEGKWNQAWAIGQEIDVEVKEDTYNGKIQFKLVAPQRDAPASDARIGEILENTRIILKMLTENNLNATFKTDVPF